MLTLPQSQPASPPTDGWTGVPAYQRTGSFHKYTRARTCIYFRKLLVRWYAGTLLTFYSLSTHSPMPTQNSTFWGVVWTCLRPAGDPRPTREKHTGRSERGNLNNRTVLDRHRGVRGEGIKSQKCASVPACQQFSKIYTCARAGVFMETAGTLVRWYTPLHSLFVNFL